MDDEGCFLPFGAILAAILSYALNQSILWAIFHFLLGWIYIAYVVITKFIF